MQHYRYLILAWQTVILLTKIIGGGSEIVTEKLNLYSLVQGSHLTKMCSAHTRKLHIKKKHLNSSEKSNFKCHPLLINNPDTSEEGKVEILMTN